MSLPLRICIAAIIIGTMIWGAVTLDARTVEQTESLRRIPLVCNGSGRIPHCSVAGRLCQRPGETGSASRGEIGDRVVDVATEQVGTADVGHSIDLYRELLNKTVLHAIEKNEYHLKWTEMGKELPRPKAILVVSAHWLSNGTKVTAMERPKTIHDFGGVPQALFDAQYPAPGAMDFAEEAKRLITTTTVKTSP